LILLKEGVCGGNDLHVNPDVHWSMGKVTNELIQLIEKQVDEHGIVVWYDAGHDYENVWETISEKGITVLAYDGSFLKLRRDLDPYLECLEESGSFREKATHPSWLILYIPRERHECRHALIEVEASGVVMDPGANSWQRNTRLRILAERVFKRIWPNAFSSGLLPTERPKSEEKSIRAF